MAAQEATIKLSPQSTDDRPRVFSGFGNNTAGVRGGGAGGPEQPVPPPRNPPPPRAHSLTPEREPAVLSGRSGLGSGCSTAPGLENSLLIFKQRNPFPPSEHKGEAALLEPHWLFPHHPPAGLEGP